MPVIFAKNLVVSIGILKLAPFARPKLGKIKVVFALGEHEKPPSLNFKNCYIHFVH
jgi:hypothetical protein